MNAGSLALQCPHCGWALPAGCAAGAGCAQGSCGGGGCALVACASCGTAFPHPQRSRLAYRLALWLARRRTASTAARVGAAPLDRLAGLPVGASARIVALAETGPLPAQQLAALGLVPGIEVRLRQRRPVLVLEVGETTLALEAHLAQHIRIAPPARRERSLKT